MQDIDVRLASPVATSYRCTRAANSLDIDQKKKSQHHLHVAGVDIDTPYNVGLVVGASGSGKTSLVRSVWGDECFVELLDPDLPIIDQFPPSWGYDDCAAALSGVGLTHVPCWIRPARTLSNGQRARAEAALQLARMRDDNGTVIIDEWTSVVDRTVAKVMSHCIAKHARRHDRRVVLCSCHYDVIEWLNPDWIIDCNQQSFINRRSLCRSYERSERLEFTVRAVERATWHAFSRYHYLSDRLPGGYIRTFGLFHGDEQIGFQCLANYVPHRRGTKMQLHSNRTVIHPDYAGLGLGILLINATCAIAAREGFDPRAKFSSLPIYRSMKQQPCWRFDGTERKHKTVVGGNMLRDTGFRHDVTTYMFRFDPSAPLGNAIALIDPNARTCEDRAQDARATLKVH